MVYRLDAVADTYLDIDLCGTAYDSEIFVLAADLSDYACSDDYYLSFDDPCGAWNAHREFLPVSVGETYYIVVDGYGVDCGDYELAIAEVDASPLTCPDGTMLEGEPPLVDGYFDTA